MTLYVVEYTDRGKKDLQKLGTGDAQRVIRAIGRVKENPRSHVEKLKTPAPGAPVYSYHVGRLRVLLEIVDDRLLILVLEVHPRTTSYRDF